ncbi:hypothetical protein VTJ04DRAFT_380 [Mycothermus thermophilus]|uniref:uncharacterized protein n=1 Tax=Humicola insolens TaxID=85995 RepID=UPI003742A646
MFQFQGAGSTYGPTTRAGPIRFTLLQHVLSESFIWSWTSLGVGALLPPCCGVVCLVCVEQGCVATYLLPNLTLSRPSLPPPWGDRFLIARPFLSEAAAAGTPQNKHPEFPALTEDNPSLLPHPAPVDTYEYLIINAPYGPYFQQVDPNTTPFGATTPSAPGPPNRPRAAIIINLNHPGTLNPAVTSCQDNLRRPYRPIGYLPTPRPAGQAARALPICSCAPRPTDDDDDDTAAAIRLLTYKHHNHSLTRSFELPSPPAAVAPLPVSARRFTHPRPTRLTCTCQSNRPPTSFV